jgi:hypothetical protein
VPSTSSTSSSSKSPPSIPAAPSPYDGMLGSPEPVRSPRSLAELSPAPARSLSELDTLYQCVYKLTQLLEDIDRSMSPSARSQLSTLSYTFVYIVVHFRWTTSQ